MAPSQPRILIVNENAIPSPTVPNDSTFSDSQVPETSPAIDLEQALTTHPQRGRIPCRFRLETISSKSDCLDRIAAACESADPFSLAFIHASDANPLDSLRMVREICDTDRELQIVVCTSQSDLLWEELSDHPCRNNNLLILKEPFEPIEALQLAVTMTHKWEMARQANLKQRDLERLVQERTLQLEHMALHDSLTGLANRTKFNDRLDEALEHSHRTGQPAAVMVLDLDQFKLINDCLGHPSGDLLLATIGARLTSLVNQHGLVARFGGDEFAIVLDTSQSVSQISNFANQILQLVNQPVILEGSTVSIDTSVGVSVAPHDGTNSIELVKNADMAMYRAKEDGRSCVRFFEPGMDEKVRLRRARELRMKDALGTNQFELFFQPLFLCRTRQICCLEALLRWRDADEGLISPGEFIPLAEESGLIVELGRWVLHEACQNAIQWPDHVRVAANVSAVQFSDGNLYRHITSALVSSGLNPNRLEVEITESLLLQECQETLDQLHQIKALGVRIVMDDFGTGYSSLSYLRSFPFDKLKIDKSFIRDLDEVDARAIVRAVASLGRSLGMETTAEGIETEQQLERVLKKGFTQYQGFLHGKPTPAADIANVFFPGKSARSSGTIPPTDSNYGLRMYLPTNQV